MRNKAVLIILCLFLFANITGCSEQKFDGSRISNDSQFILEYSVLNEMKTHEIALEKGDILDVSIESLSGSVDIIVVDTKGNEIYRGNDPESCNFKLTVQEKDTYTFKVTGTKAKGSVSFVKAIN